MTRRRLLCGLLLASVVLACFAGWWVASHPRVTRARMEQVKEGMPREEVIRTVGGPPDIRHNGYMNNTTDLEQWSSHDGHLFVQFDDKGTTIGVWVLKVQPPKFSERIRRWLGL